jgi:hypothetical protein
MARSMGTRDESLQAADGSRCETDLVSIKETLWNSSGISGSSLANEKIRTDLLRTLIISGWRMSVRSPRESGRVETLPPSHIPGSLVEKAREALLVHQQTRLLVQDFIQIQQLIRHHRPCRQRSHIQRRVGLRFTDGDQLGRIGGMPLIIRLQVGK